MQSFFPLSSKVVDSSLWELPDHAVKVFITMMVKQDHDNVVRATAYNIAQWTRKPEAEVLDALKILAAPDTRRVEPQKFEGRRIQRVEDGWLILNGAYYQDLWKVVSRRQYKTRKQREYREARADNKEPVEVLVSDEEWEALRARMKRQEREEKIRNAQIKKSDEPPADGPNTNVDYMTAPEQVAHQAKIAAPIIDEETPWQ